MGSFFTLYLQYAFCNHISCQEIKEGSTIQVTNGQLPNGLFIIELEGQTGTYTVEKDEETGPANEAGPDGKTLAPAAEGNGTQAADPS